MKRLATIAWLFCSAAANAQGSEVEARILSTYHGLDQIPERAGGLALICGRPVGGQNGMPVDVTSGFFHDRGDDANPETRADVISTW
ncbi:MAG: hypothetical protein OXI73_00720 [Rhodospirillales bacterium]|nr:hypothetical protein [Rhodospirillales bacterium]